MHGRRRHRFRQRYRLRAKRSTYSSMLAGRIMFLQVAEI
jgi:hypothetical protein